jgi:hypothetical protein
MKQAVLTKWSKLPPGVSVGQMLCYLLIPRLLLHQPLQLQQTPEIKKEESDEHNPADKGDIQMGYSSH